MAVFKRRARPKRAHIGGELVFIRWLGAVDKGTGDNLQTMTPPRSRRSLKWLITGDRVPDAIYGRVVAPFTALVIAVLAFLLGLIGTLFTDPIREGTRLLFSSGARSPNWWIIAFWFASLFWALLFYVRLIAEAEERRSLQSAISRCPNPRALEGYKSFYERLEQTLAPCADIKGEDESALLALGKNLQAGLRLIVDFARVFADPVQNAPRGCNVMLVGVPADLPPEVKSRVRFVPPEHNLVSLRAILFMVPDLIVSADQEGKPVAGHVPAIALPVPKGIYAPRGSRTALPGAPVALLTGVLSVHRDTRKLLEDEDEQGYDDFDGEVRKELTQYFSVNGEGKNVRSFASVRIGNEDRPVGVLNLDYSEPGILGDDDYYGTFFALISPVLVLLREPVERYGKLVHSLGRFG